MKKVFNINDETFLHHGFAPDMVMSFEEKRDFYLMCLEQGMSRSTCFRRFLMDKGFDKWELIGVDLLKRIFLNEVVPEKDAAVEAGEKDTNQGDRGYLAVLALGEGIDLDKPGAFYQFLTEHEYGALFRKWMIERGMSWTTTRMRFSNEEWKPYERKGINKIMTEWYNRNSETQKLRNSET